MAQLDEITGVGRAAAQELIAEIGVDMGRFASAAHLVSWAKFCPQVHQSAGKTKPKGRGKGNPWLAGTLGNIVAAAARTDSFLGARYQRIAKPRQAEGDRRHRQLGAGHRLPPAVRPGSPVPHLGAEHYEVRIDKQRRARSLAAQLQAATGQRIVIREGKAVIVQPEAA